MSASVSACQRACHLASTSVFIHPLPTDPQTCCCVSCFVVARKRKVTKVGTVATSLRWEVSGQGWNSKNVMRGEGVWLGREEPGRRDGWTVDRSAGSCGVKAQNASQ